jgi:uncharacterized protein (TIGR00369 family)
MADARPDQRLRALLDEVRTQRDPGRLLVFIPYLRFLGVSVHMRDGDLIAELPGSEQLIGNPVLPALHGGTVGALLESTAILKLLLESETAGVPKTITLTVDYLRSPKVVPTFARATITRLGRRVANVQIHAWQEAEDRPVAVAHAHFLLQSLGD